MNTVFEKAFAHTIGLEGRYSNNPNDSGGETMFGVTKRVAEANGYRGQMKDLSLSFAKVIAKQQYWDTLRLDLISTLVPAVAIEMFDTAYNAGISRSGSFLQVALNAFNLGESIYPDTKVDGVIGPVTIENLRKFIRKRGVTGEIVLVKALNAQQGFFYLQLTQQRKKDEDFVFGWFLNRV